MLIVDISNIIHSGNTYAGNLFLPNPDVLLKGIPYFFSKIANYSLKSSNLVLAFDPEPSTNMYIRKYPTHRLVQPRVLWELRILKDLLELIGVPLMQVEGISADSLIYSALEDNAYMDENHYILSADQDLACNVRVRGNGYENRMIGYNINSWNVDPKNFKDIYNVPYNFMNIHKLCTGCSSDCIPSATNGVQIESKFYEYLNILMEIDSDYTSDDFDELTHLVNIFEYNSLDYFLTWLDDVKMSHLKNEFIERAEVIFPKKIGVGDIPPTDWGLLNGLVMYMFNDTKLTNNRVLAKPLDKDLQDKIHYIVTNTKIVNPNIFVHDEAETDFTSLSLEDLTIFSKEGIDI